MKPRPRRKPRGLTDVQRQQFDIHYEIQRHSCNLVLKQLIKWATKTQRLWVTNISKLPFNNYPNQVELIIPIETNLTLYKRAMIIDLITCKDKNPTKINLTDEEINVSHYEFIFDDILKLNNSKVLLVATMTYVEIK